MTLGKGRHSAKRDNCLHCQGRYILAQEEEDKAMARVAGEVPKATPPKETSTSLSGCMGEGVTYTLECQTCRSQGTKRTYIGESSRSPYQCGVEHTREIREGVLDHPMVQHFWEEHKGVEQKVLMRMSSKMF